MNADSRSIRLDAARRVACALAFLVFALPLGCSDDDGAAGAADSHASHDGHADHGGHDAGADHAAHDMGSMHDDAAMDPGSDDTGEADTGGTTPAVAYAFESKLVAGSSSVSYSGQTARHVLIADLTSFIKGMGGAIDSQDWEPTDEGDVVGALDFYFRFDGDADGGDAHGVATEPASKQATYDDISTQKDLVGKLAGNDPATDHVDWTTNFGGWSDASIAAHGGGIDTPENLVIALFETLEAEALHRVEHGARTVDGEALPVYVTAAGQDLSQLVQKFLLGAVAFHQGADDYLDSDVDSKGLKASNDDPGDGSAYTALENAWDEGFGYFGAARDYDRYSDNEIAGSADTDAGDRADWNGYHDSDGDGAIDLKSEYNFGASVNAAKRDRGASEAAPTDYTKDVFEAFVAGRQLIADTAGALSPEQLATLEGHRDAIVEGWEKALAATAVHYINDSLQDLAKVGTADFELADLAKNWSELKGFALSFQFNPRSPLSDAAFAEFHALIGDAPDFSADGVEAYRGKLRAARKLLKAAYEFADANMGDDDGEGGW